MEALNTQTSVPLYSQLAEQLRQDIYTGRFTQGEKIPSEFELSRLYNVSRSTVRKAISVLVSENLLETTHGKGTFVSSPKINQNSSGFLSFTENVRSMGKTLITRTIHMTHVVPSEHQKHFFRLDEKEKLLEVERLRYIDHIRFTKFSETIMISDRSPEVKPSNYATLPPMKLHFWTFPEDRP